MDEDYSKEHEMSVHWSSIPEVKEFIQSIIGDMKLTISDKDDVAISFNEYIKK